MTVHNLVVLAEMTDTNVSGLDMPISSNTAVCEKQPLQRMKR